MTHTSEVHKNDIGTIFRVTIIDENDTIVDVSSASTKRILFKKPNGTLLEKTATFYTNGTDGIIQYITITGDLDTVGVWQLQAYVVLSGNQYRSNITTFKVYRNLD